MRNALNAALALLLLLLLAACSGSGATTVDGDSGDDQLGHLNEPCMADGLCRGSLECIDNICVYPDPDGDADPDPELEPEPECLSDKDCSPGYECKRGKCVEIPIDGDEESELDGDIIEGESEDGDVVPGPRLSLNPPELDFGSVPVGQTSERTLLLQNTGIENLRITAFDLHDAESDEGTFALSAPITLPFSLAPGEQISIGLEFTRAAQGAANASISIDSNDASDARRVVPMRSEGWQPVKLQVTPESLDFEVVARSQNKQLILEIMNARLGDDVGDLVIRNIVISEGDDTFQIMPFGTLPLNLAAGKKASVPVVAAPQEHGILEGEIEIYHNDPGFADPHRVALSVVAVVPELEVTPAAVQFGPVAIGEPRSSVLTLRNTGGQDVNINSISFSSLSNASFGIDYNPDENGLGEPPATVAVGAFATVALTYTPSTFGEHEADLYIETNDFASAQKIIHAEGMGAPPDLSILPGSLDFGEVQVGHNALRTVTIDFQGAGTVDIKNIFLSSGSRFEITSKPDTPATLGEGEQAGIEIAYAPPVTSSLDEDTLNIVVGDADTITYEVPMQGKSVAAYILVSYDQNNALMNVQVVPESVPVLPEMSEEQRAIWAERAAVTVENTGSAPLHINSITVDPNQTDSWGVDVQLPLTVQPQESTTFDVLFAPRQVTNYTGKIIICSDAANAGGSVEDCGPGEGVSQVLQIPRTPVDLDIFIEPVSGSIDFGKPEVPAPNGFTTEIVYIKNTGSYRLSISDIAIEGNEAALNSFFIDDIQPPESEGGGWTLSTNPTDQILVTLRFQPPDAGSASGALAIHHNDKDAAFLGGAPSSQYPVMSVLLAGNGEGNFPPMAIVKSPQGVPEDPHTGVRQRVVEFNPMVWHLLDGTASYDNDSEDFVSTYKWSIEETSGFEWLEPDNLTGSTAQLRFTEPGDYHMALEVGDRYGLTSPVTADSQVTIEVRVDPVAVAEERVSGSDEVTARVREPLLLTGANSYDDDGEIVAYRWFVRAHPNGELSQFSTQMEPSYTFVASGMYDILLEVEDDDGRVSERDSMFVVVQGNDRIKIEAIWSNGGNVDLHYIKPGGTAGTATDCYPQNKTPNWGDYGSPRMTQTSSDGSQPEVIVHDNPADGIYTVRAEYITHTEACGNVESCRHFDHNCGVCGCSCWEPICYIQIDSCCKSCDECIYEWVCEPKPTTVTFYIYINGQAEPNWVYTGEGTTINEAPGAVEFSLHRENGFFVIPD